ncbi:MAG: thioredoxin [Bacteroidetes bacterium]|nr:thioredoxin [Bacteroidota bacterium]
MKKLFVAIIAISTATLISCGNASDTQAQKAAQPEKSTSVSKSDESGKPVHLTKETFLEKVMDYEKNRDTWVYEGDKPCIIDFYADWCKPCKLIAPIMEELAKEYEGQIYVYKIDTEEQRELASIFGIRSIPSVLFVPMEGKPQMSTGALPKETFKQAIDNFLLKPDNSTNNQ